MVSFPLPVVLVLVGAIYWPVTLAVAFALAALGFALRPLWARIVCFVLASALVADCLLAVWLPR